jgi:hypothetical protein
MTPILALTLFAIVTKLILWRGLQTKKEPTFSSGSGTTLASEAVFLHFAASNPDVCCNKSGVKSNSTQGVVPFYIFFFLQKYEDEDCPGSKIS